MNIPYLRLYGLSLVNYLKYEVLPLSFSEYVENEELEADEDNGGFKIIPSALPSPVSRGRGWVPFDQTTVNGRAVVDTSAEQTSRITVTGATSYSVDYIRGRLFNCNTTPTSVSYYWNYVSVVEGWVGIDPPPLPVVCVDTDSKKGFGLQLGGGTRDIIKGAIYVFATSEVEKRDITDVIHNSIENRSLAISNWHEGEYLNFDGSFNNSFTRSAVNGVGLGMFTEVVSTLSGPPIDWSEINRHRSRINFVLEVPRD